ncbi:hypothetical protein C6P45_001187 [Maudiozyma exigua]|uniref:G-patch domain-containing protein n=1 Tax=Maudiozyma exigua TaxID=34358 RepID=A0A9P6WDF1_MAUEX|nr:hypothetical protein C6P45_001187 [Kazachstania exigua]
MSLTSLNSSEYLKSYGWEEGKALKEGGLRKPILAKHKRDKKGLGSAPGGDDSEAWWERLFDGHLKNLEVTSSSTKSGIVFKQNEVVATAVSKQSSPLYQWFVKGEGLKGTIKQEETSFKPKVHTVVSSITKSKKRSRSDKDHHKDNKHKKCKLDKKSKKSKDEKKNKDKKRSKKEKKSKHKDGSKHKSKSHKDKKDKSHKHKSKNIDK